MKTEEIKKASCFRCEHYKNTWNPSFPRACKFFGFKSAKIPSAVIVETTGEECSSFIERKKPNPQ